MKKLPRQSAFSQQTSTVANLVSEAREQQAANEHDGRGRAAHAGKLGTDNRGAAKATYYISTDSQELVREMATAEDVAQSDIVEVALIFFHRAYAAGQIDLFPLKEPARSLKCSWKLDLEKF
jgi:hypothetical protein